MHKVVAVPKHLDMPNVICVKARWSVDRQPSDRQRWLDCASCRVDTGCLIVSADVLFVILNVGGTEHSPALPTSE
eukprot:3760399-Ditylum_brightwellii.AAC.1